MDANANFPDDYIIWFYVDEIPRYISKSKREGMYIKWIQEIEGLEDPECGCYDEAEDLRSHMKAEMKIDFKYPKRIRYCIETKKLISWIDEDNYTYDLDNEWKRPINY